MKFRKKPIVISAFRVGIDSIPVWFCSGPVGSSEIMRTDDGYVISTLEGEMACTTGNWVIRGVNGELYPCRHDVFIETYEAVI